MTAYGIYVFVVCFLVGGAVFAYRNRAHRFFFGRIHNWWKIFVSAIVASIAVGIIGGVSLSDIVAGLILAPILGFFAVGIGVYLWRGIKYLTKFAFKESAKNLKIKVPRGKP